MVTEPAATPPARPADEPSVVIVAIDALLLVQLPPATVLLSVTVAPAHTLVGPVIAGNRFSTVTVVVEVQPVGSVYDIVALPRLDPVTTPDDEPTLATEVLLLVHVPPVMVSENIVAEPTQTFVAPVITEGFGSTVTILLIVHPVPIV